MLESLKDIFDLQAMMLILILLVAARAFMRILSGSNPIEAWHFVASSDKDGKQWGDPKKLAVMVFIFASTVFVGYTFWAHPVDNLYVVAVFFGWAIAMLGIDVFAGWARSFVDRRFGSAGANGKPPAA
jgi:hypothetical protein